MKLRSIYILWPLLRISWFDTCDESKLKALKISILVFYIEIKAYKGKYLPYLAFEGGIGL